MGTPCERIHGFVADLKVALSAVIPAKAGIHPARRYELDEAKGDDIEENSCSTRS
jgi:hypothetical protein